MTYEFVLVVCKAILYFNIFNKLVNLTANPIIWKSGHFFFWQRNIVLFQQMQTGVFTTRNSAHHYYCMFTCKMYQISFMNTTSRYSHKFWRKNNLWTVFVHTKPGFVTKTSISMKNTAVTRTFLHVITHLVYWHFRDL